MPSDEFDSASSVSITEVKCPSCNGALALPPDADVVTCPFCGSTVHVSIRSQQQRSGIEPDGTIRDPATGNGLFRVQNATGWQVAGTTLQRTGSTSRPFLPQADLHNRAGGTIQLRMGDAGTRNSAGMQALMGMYGGHLAGIDHVNYAEVPDPLAIADSVANGIAASAGASDIRFTRQLACPNLESRRPSVVQHFQQLDPNLRITEPLVAIVLREYAMTRNGQPWKTAVYVHLEATKDASGLGEGLGAGMMGGLSGLMDGLGSLFGGGQARPAPTATPAQENDPYAGVMGFLRGGGLVGKAMRERNAYQSTQAPPQQPYQQMPPQQNATTAQAQPASAGSATWCAPDFAPYVQSGTIYWSVPLVTAFTAPASAFDDQLTSSFIPLASTAEVHPDITRLAIGIAQQEAAQIQQATQTQLAQNQAAFDAQQAAHRQQQAAFDAYNQSITDTRNAHHQQFMASSREQFGHSAPDYSEAIRGVNTYTTSDGREVEVSVQADRAFENQAGDVIGTSGAFDPGANWTEIPRT